MRHYCCEVRGCTAGRATTTKPTKGVGIMKHTIEFDGYEERHELLTAVHALDYAVACEEIRNYIRGLWKHGHNYKSTEDCLDDIYQFVCESIPEID